MAGLALWLQAPIATAQVFNAIETSGSLEQRIETGTPPLKNNAQSSSNTYILGPGDRLAILQVNLPELSGVFTVGPDGNLFLPRLRTFQVEGLTIEEVTVLLNEHFRTYIREPDVFITPVSYRPIRIYVGGEVARPGYYTFSGNALVQNILFENDKNTFDEKPLLDFAMKNTDKSKLRQVPTLFDALQAARGVTPFSHLEKVQITRKLPASMGKRKIQANVNFLRLITKGDEEVNIRLYDGDTIFVGKSDRVLRDQLRAASRTNLSPDFIEVFVSGRVKEPGPQRLPQGASLNQAIASAGGPKLLKGRVEFLRFTQDGATDRRIFAFKPKSKSGEYHNPILMQGDVVRVNESLISASLEVLNEITTPAVGLYSVYSLFGNNQ